MEDILDVYCFPYYPYYPYIPLMCMEEQACQLIRETRQGIAVEQGKPERIDYEYKRNGTANVFMFVDSLRGSRYVSVRERKTSKDWTEEVRKLLEVS